MIVHGGGPSGHAAVLTIAIVTTDNTATPENGKHAHQPPVCTCPFGIVEPTRKRHHKRCRGESFDAGEELTPQNESQRAFSVVATAEMSEMSSWSGLGFHVRDFAGA